MKNINKNQIKDNILLNNVYIFKKGLNFSMYPFKERYIDLESSFQSCRELYPKQYNKEEVKLV